jgi:hypothetical protein
LLFLQDIGILQVIQIFILILKLILILIWLFLYLYLFCYSSILSQNRFVSLQNSNFYILNRYHLILANYHQYKLYKTKKINSGSLDPNPDLFLVNMGPLCGSNQAFWKFEGSKSHFKGQTGTLQLFPIESWCTSCYYILYTGEPVFKKE